MAWPCSPDPPAARWSQQTTPDDVAPSRHGHYSRFITTTNHSAPAPRIGTRSLVVFATWLSPFTSKQQVPTFRSKACHTVTSPIHRMPHGQASGSRHACPGPLQKPRFRHHLYAFDASSAIHFRSSRYNSPDGSLPPFPPTLTTTTLNRSSLTAV